MLEPVDVNVYENDELKHWGILGMHWGVRRYQNEDGTLTPEGRERYGVGTSKEIEKLSYSKDYEVLKRKKDKTEKEKLKLKRLEDGRKHFNKSAFDENYWNKLEDDLTVDKLEDASRNYMEYFNSTNYGKGMKEAEILTAIPTTLIGGAIDAGAIYAQFHMGSPIAFYGLATGLGMGIGCNIGSENYGKKHQEELKEELKKAGVNSSYKKSEHIVKDAKKELTNYRNETDSRRESEKYEKLYRGEGSVNSAAKRASRVIKEDKAYSMVYSNPQYYLKDNKWSYDGKTYGSVDGLINALIKNNEV